MICGWMTRVAAAWLVYRLGGSDAAVLLGVVGFAGQAPAFLLTPVAGVWVDRWNRHRLRRNPETEGYRIRGKDRNTDAPKPANSGAPAPHERS
jgi:hypothetical protein